MATPRAQILVHRYVSGWCEAALHYRCKGSYAAPLAAARVTGRLSPAPERPEPQLRPACPGNSARPGA